MSTRRNTNFSTRGSKKRSRKSIARPLNPSEKTFIQEYETNDPFSQQNDTSLSLSQQQTGETRATTTANVGDVNSTTNV